VLMELTIIPLSRGQSLSASLAPVINLIDASGLDYQVTAFGTLVEGSLDQLLDLGRRCHLEARKQTERVLTTLKLDDFGERSGELKGAILRVEQKLNKQVKKS
jgi:uncharacterized protein YqgV (UPF0045/DUF77 family)